MFIFMNILYQGVWRKSFYLLITALSHDTSDELTSKPVGGNNPFDFCL